MASMVGPLRQDETGPASRDPLVDVVADLVRPGLILDQGGEDGLDWSVLARCLRLRLMNDQLTPQER